MPKKKPSRLARKAEEFQAESAVKERNFKAASAALEAARQSSQSLSLRPYTDLNSHLNFFASAGFQVFSDPNHPIFIASLPSWMFTSVGNITALPQQTLPNPGYSAAQNSLVPVHSIITPMETPPLPYANQPEKFTSLAEERDIPCEISWELEDNHTLPTMILKVLFYPKLPFGEKHYSFPCFSSEKAKLLASPITAADPFVIQHYKCAMEWFELLRSCSFPHVLSNKDFTNLVTYQIIYDSLSQMINVLQLYFFYHQDACAHQEIFSLIKKRCDEFSVLAPSSDIFKQNSEKIAQQLEKLTSISNDFTWTLMAQTLFQTKDYGISSFHRISPELILYIQTGPFSDLETCNFTGLLSWLHSLMLLPNIARLAQYTIEASDLNGRFLKENYIGKKLQFSPNTKATLLGSNNIIANFMEKTMSERTSRNDNFYKLPDRVPEVLITLNLPSVAPALNTNRDLAEQLFKYLKEACTPFKSPFSYYEASPNVQIVGMILNRLVALAKYCVDTIVMPAIKFEITRGSKKLSTHTNLYSLEIKVGSHTFRVYTDYLSADNYLLIREALYIRLEILILENLIEDAKCYQIHPEVSQNFYLLFKDYFQHYFTLLTTLEACTQQTRMGFIERHNADLETKAAQAAKELIAKEAEEAKNKSQASKKNKPSKPAKKISHRPKLTLTNKISEKDKADQAEAPNPPKEALLQKQLNAITKGTNILDKQHTTQEKINYLVDCIASLQELLKNKEKESGDTETSLDIVKTGLRIETFYYRGLLLPYQATQYFKAKTINHFNALLSTLRALKEELESISSTYAYLLSEQDSIPEERKTLEILLTSITLTISAVNNNIETIKKELQKDFDAAQQKPRTPRPIFEKPLYVAVPSFKSLPGFLDPKRAMQDLEKVNTEFSVCCTHFESQLKDSVDNNKPCYSQSYLFTEKINRQQTKPQNDNEENRGLCIH